MQPNGPQCEGLKNECSSHELRVRRGSHAIPHNFHLSVEKGERPYCHMGTGKSDSARRLMSAKSHKSDDDARVDVRDASSSDRPMLVSDAPLENIAPDAAPNRRLRNWILLANAVAWVAIAALVRLLFF